MRLTWIWIFAILCALWLAGFFDGYVIGKVEPSYSLPSIPVFVHDPPLDAAKLPKGNLYLYGVRVTKSRREKATATDESGQNWNIGWTDTEVEGIEIVAVYEGKKKPLAFIQDGPVILK